MGWKNERQILTTYVLAFACFGVLCIGCGEEKESANATTDTTDSSRFTDNSGDAFLLTQNREALALLEESTQTAKDILALLKTITDDETAQAALPKLEAFRHQVLTEQEEWMFSSRGAYLFANEEARDAWVASAQAFSELRDPLLTERYRIKEASDGSNRSPMVRAFYAFKYLPGN